MSELKLCPFCGDEPTVIDCDETVSFYVECENEECEIRPLSDSKCTRIEAVEIWNTRATTKGVHTAHIPVPDVPELVSVGNGVFANGVMVGFVGLEGVEFKLTTDIRERHPVVRRDQAAVIIDSLSMLLNNKQADCDQKDAIIAAKDKEIERLRKKLRQEFELGLKTLERAEAAEAKFSKIKRE